MEAGVIDRMCRSDRSSSSLGPSFRQVVEVSVSFKSGRERWLALMRLVHEAYPFCTMYGVHIADGTVVSCENIQRSLMFGETAPASPEAGPELFDEKWQALETLCVRMGSGRLAELKFSDARPVAAKTVEGGRRFRKFSGRGMDALNS